MNRNLFLALSVAASAAVLSQAASVSYSVATQPDPDLTNWAKTLELPQFDPSLSILTGITVQIEGRTAGEIRVETPNPTPSTVISTLQSQITLALPGGATLQVNPSSTITDDFTAFDGEIDFAGTSGATHLDLSASVTESAVLPAGDWAPYVGLGVVSLPVEALGLSSSSGPGAIMTQFTSLAAATVDVTYEYREFGVPDAGATGALLGGAFLALGAFRRKF
jgi:hypothetical protein